MLVSALLSSTAAPRAHAQNDAPIFTWPGKVKVSTSTLEIREGESATYNLWLTRQPSADGWWVRVHVDGVVRYDGGFDQDEGYKGIRWTPSVGWEFNKNNSNPAVATPPRGVTIRAVQDADDEDELVEFTHEVWDENTNCPPSLHWIAKVTVRIIDDDRDSGGTLPKLSIQDTPVVEGNTAEFRVRLTPSSEQTVTVDFATADVTAEAGTDYTAQSDTLTFRAGQTIKRIFVPTTDDRFHEPEEHFRVTLSNPSGATLADATGEGRISDNDRPELSIGSASVEEGNTARFEVRLAPPSEQTVTVAYATMNVTAEAGTDYTARSGTLTFSARQTMMTISVPTTDDTERESDEHFRVTLSNPSGATLNDATGEGTIFDNDGGPTMPELSIGDASVEEGGMARFEVRLAPSNDQTVTVAYSTTDGTAAAGTDYTAQSDTLTFPASQTAVTMTISVQTTDDDEQESDERFMVILSSPSGATLNDDTGEGTIIDNDGDGGGGNGGGGGDGGGGSDDGDGDGSRDVGELPTLSIDDATVVEGDLAKFEVTLSEAATAVVMVDYSTVDGTAVARSDYTTTSGTLSFEQGEERKTILVPTVQDATAEETEVFTMQLSSPSGATVANGTGTGTITDDDEPPMLTIDDAPPVDEGDAAAFVVRLSAASGLAVTVAYRTVDGTAEAGLDYKSASGELRFEPGETTQTVSVETLEDELSEDAERFTVELSAASGATVSDGIGEGTISDDDDAPELSIDDAPAVSEGETAEFTVRLSEASGAAVSVSYRTVDGTAVAGSDYKSASGELRFEPGEAARTVTVETLADELAEDTEQFTVELSAPLGATVADGVGEGTISDDDDAPELSIDDVPAVSEGETAEFTVRLSATSGRAVTVSYRTVDGTAEAGLDYKSASGELRFEPGETTQTVSVETLEDELSEDAERFTVELSAASGATVSDGIGEGTISDDDDAPELSIDDAPAVSEGETAEFTVRLSEASGAAVSVSYRTVDGTAVAGLDYAATEGTLRYEPGETTQAISAETLADGLAEDVERFTVELSAPSGATVSDGTGVGTITDDVKERIGKINRVILPEVGRALAFSAVTCRIDQVLAGGTTRGRAALPPARPSLSPALASGRWASQPSLSGRPSLSPALTSGRWAAAGTQPLPLERTLDDLSFPARSQEEEGGDGRFAAWGCADHRNLSGDPYGPIAWSGGVSSVHMGADTRLGPGLLAGLSLSRSWGSFDYQVGGRNSAASGGEYQLGMAGVHPYLAWSVSPDLDVWGTVSHYWGDIRIVDDLVGRVQTSPATLNSGMMGVSGRLMTRGATTVKLKGDWGLASINAAGGGKVFEEATANIRRLRLRTEVSHARKLSAGKSLTPWGELGVRHDGGDGQHGAGLEVGGGLRFQDLGGGLTAESYGRWLALHHGTLQEWGFGALLRYAPGRSGRGPSVSLGPSWGDTASGVQRLWERGVTDPTLYEVPGSRLDAQFGYGFTAFRGRGLLTPYARLSLAHEAARGYRLGSRLALGPSASVSIEAQRREYPAAPINHALLVLGTLQF